MRVVRSLRQMTALADRWRAQRRAIGFVPTMGALHEGHLSLIRRARRDNDIAVVSIFVNPLQFGPREDYTSYPRPFAKDVRLARAAGVDAIFAPSVAAMHPRGHATRVEVERLGSRLCGRFRPGHFRGVATVVAQLLHIVRPHRVYVGQKDAQQVVVIRRMVRDLRLSVTVRVLPLVRDRDGVAMSSRNARLSPEDRQQARCLYQALRQARAAIRDGARRADPIRRRALAFLRRQDRVRPEYFELVDTQELRQLRRLRGRVLIAVAARVGRTRLIDNVVVTV